MANPHLIIPTGTQVVVRHAVSTGAGVAICPAGAVGEVVAAPADASHAYRVRLPHGAEVSLRRHELSIRKHVKTGEMGDPSAVLREHDLYEHVIYRCVVDSRAYGLASSASDVTPHFGRNHGLPALSPGGRGIA